MKDMYKYADGSRWTYKKGGWFNPRITKKTSKCWKDQRKTRRQYKRTPSFNLFKPYEVDECGIVITNEQIDELFYLFNTYEPRALGY